jgi:uncharacterized damage-inducible protein DinB
MELIEFYEQVERFARVRMLENLEKLPAEEFTRERPTIGRGSIRNALIHIPSSEYFWVRRVLQGDKDASLGPYENYAMVGDVRTKWIEVAAETKRYLRALTPAQLVEARTYRFPDGKSTLRTDFVIHHVLTHEFHHKGQLMMALRMLGYELQETDLL